MTREEKKSPPASAKAETGQNQTSQQDYNPSVESVQQLGAQQLEETQGQTKQFVECLFEPHDSVEVRMHPWEGSVICPANVLPMLVDRLLARNGNECGIFVGVNPRFGGEVSRRCKTSSKDCSKSDPCGKCDRCVTLARCVVADFDNCLIENARMAWEGASMPEPTMTINSGHGIHAYWRLEESVEPAQWRLLQANLALKVGSDPTIKNPSRIMRLPGFVNHKHPIADSRIIEADSSRRYSLSDLPDWLMAEEDTTPTLTEPVAATLDTMKQAAAYVEAIPGAVQGENGDNCTYRVACKLFNDFGLSIDQGMPLMMAWNRRCEPPWPERELRQIVENAIKYAKQPRGNKVGIPQNGTPILDSRSAPRVQRASENQALVFTPLADSLREPSAEHQWVVEPHNGIVLPARPADLLTADLGYTDLSLPIDALPQALRQFVTEGATSISCQPDFIALPLLAALGAAIGRTRQVEIKRGWVESPALWVMLVGSHGVAKSPALELAVKPIRAATDGCSVKWMNDTTVEALAVVLQDTPRGVILIQDELSAWIRGFDQYKGGKGADEQFYISSWNGAPVRIDRKTEKTGPIVIPKPFLSITGGIQPAVVSKLLSEGRIENGFAARFLVVCPSDHRRTYTEDVVSQAASDQIASLFEKLFQLDFAPESDGGGPISVQYTAAGKHEWRRWIHAHQDENSSLAGNDGLRGVWAKMEGYAARLMLVVQVVRCASGETDTEDIEPVTVGMVERLLGYFKAHAIWLYGEVLEGRNLSPPSNSERTIAWMKRHGDPGIRPRELISAKIAKTSEEAKEILSELVKHRVAEWRSDGDGKVERLFLKSALSSQHPGDATGCRECEPAPAGRGPNTNADRRHDPMAPAVAGESPEYPAERSKPPAAEAGDLNDHARTGNTAAPDENPQEGD